MKFFRPILPVLLLLSISLACNLINHLPSSQTPTATLTPSPTVTPTPTNTSTPTPTSTPIPAARVSQGDQAIFTGQWDVALGEYQTTLADNPDPEVQFAALMGIGRVQLLMGDYSEAIDSLQSLVEDQPQATHAPEAYFLLAQAHAALDNHIAAAEAYGSYLESRPGVIDSYIHERIGDALFAAGNYAGAIQEFQNALQAPRLTEDLFIDIKIAESYAMQGDYTTAIIGYQDIYARSSNDFIKAQMDLLIGRAHTELDQMEEAYEAYLDAVENYPQAGDSYAALLTLVNDGVPVDELDRGLVDYYAGQYGVALAAFDRYLVSEPEDMAIGYYYKGQSFNGLGEHGAAIAEWDKVIENYPESQYWDRAWEMKAFTQWFHMDQYTQATDTLVEFVERAPLHARAAEFLFDAGRVHERAGRLQRAANIWERVGSEYPGSDQAFRALFLAGITRYRTGDHRSSHAVFQQALPLAKSPGEQAEVAFWSGKCLEALGEPEAAQAAWEQAAAVDPTGYYSARSRDILAGERPFNPPQEYVLSFDPARERVEAEAWMRTVFDLPEEADLSGPGTLASDPRFQRGNELWQLGLQEEARSEFEALRSAIQSDPVNTYRLANHLIDIGLYRSGIFAARQVLNLAGMDDAETMSAPIYFNHLRFGTYFRDLVISLAQEYDFHPLLLFSIMRQESLFEGFVRSSAGARGLMQIIPSTGAEVASRLGWPEGYSDDDLYRPNVNMRLGVEYLDRQMAFLGGDLYAALAAYNGGPGNANTWKGMAPDDPDLFLEVIRFEETRSYIKRIYEIFSIYEEIYGLEP
ncbi:MAG TPA: tetratricopeptide repeat protein [Anaerolineales bacterium]